MDGDKLWHLLAAPGTAIFNSSLREGNLSDLWKNCYCRPSAKETSARLIGKRHSAHITYANICEVFWSYSVLNWVDDVITPQIDERQFRGLSGTGTTDGLVEMVHPWYEATDQSDTFVRVLLVDYSKASITSKTKYSLRNSVAWAFLHILIGDGSVPDRPSTARQDWWYCVEYRLP